MPPSEEPTFPLDPANPELTTALKAFLQGYEQKWLDEPIPALAGHAPPKPPQTPPGAAT
jgi:hypothetical protein